MMSNVIGTGRALLLAAVLAVGSVRLSPVAAQAPAERSGSFTDKRDGKKYKTAVIAGKTWMAENLNYRTPKGSWCYENDTYYCDKYGRLYDWKTAKIACPAGWHLPSRREWDILGRVVGGERLRGEWYDAVDWYGAGKALKAKSGWSDPADKSGNGDDAYGFSALPGGYRGYYDSAYNAADIDGYWWTSTENRGDRAHSRNMYYGNDYLIDNGFHIGVGLSVRCLQDERKYAVTVSSAGENAKGGGDYVFGETITLTAGTVPNKKFSHWTTASDGVAFADANDAKTAFTMPANNVTVKANFDTIIVETGALTDARDGKTYRTTTIGGRTWMAENLNYKADSSWCYNDSDSYCDKYGRRYVWNTAKKVCPAGWHLPTSLEWGYLEEVVGGQDIAAKRLKSKSGWAWNKYRKVSGNGTDDYGFSALPNGGRGHPRDAADHSGFWWTTVDDDSAAAARLKEGYGLSGVPFVAMHFDTDGVSEGGQLFGASVRCVQNQNVAEEERWKKELKRRNAEREAEERAAAKRLIERNTSYFVDSRDGQKYRAIKIGAATWMAQNLNYRTPKGSWCYGNNASNCAKYGRLYDWETAKRACPSGWYLPSKEEWSGLVFAARGDDMCLSGGGWAGRRLRAKSGWAYYGNGFNGTDELGFSALPGGYREFYDDGRFKKADSTGSWWTSSREYGFYSDDYANYLKMDYDNFGVSGVYGGFNRTERKTSGLSVRCVQGDGGGARSDSARLVIGEAREKRKMEEWKREKELRIAEAKKREKEEQQRARPLIEKLSVYFIDSRDGKKYRAVTIGGKRWMAQNLNYKPKSGNSWCYNDSVSYCDKYGRLYDWEAAETACPPGWRFPTRKDWTDLDTAVGGVFEAHNKLRAISGWNWDDANDKSGGGTDAYGFSALPGGSRESDSGKFYGVGEEGYWWMAADSAGGDAAIRTYGTNSIGKLHFGDVTMDGHSVRCLQDTTGGKRKEQK